MSFVLQFESVIRLHDFILCVVVLLWCWI